MQNFEFEIWDIVNKTFDKVMTTLFLSTITLSVLYMILFDYSPWIFIFCAIFLVLGFIQHYGVKYHQVGKIIFNDTGISISNNPNILYTDILKIKLNFGDVKGNLTTSNTRSLFSLFMLSKGVRNEIVIRTQNEKLSFRVLCTEDSDYLRFRLLGRFLKEMGINVKMSDNRV